MGMQCHFSLNDLPPQVEVMRIYDKDSDTVSYSLDNGYTVSGDNGPNVWFDIGSRTPDQMYMIQYLIQNRICFQCS